MGLFGFVRVSNNFAQFSNLGEIFFSDLPFQLPLYLT